MTDQSVVTKDSAEIAVPSYIQQGANRGNENVQKDDIQLPRLDVLQALSPQINKKKDDYIPGAEVGTIFNTLTGELYPNGVSFTPVAFVKRYLLWVDRKKDADGGLRGVYDTEPLAEKALEESEDKEKLEVVPTAEHLCVMDDGTEVIISMSKSKMKVSRKFNSLIRLAGGDRFSHRYKLTSVDDKGSKGEYQNIAVDSDGFPEEKVYMACVKIYNAIQENGQKQASYEGEMDTGAENKPTGKEEY